MRQLSSQSITVKSIIIAMVVSAQHLAVAMAEPRALTPQEVIDFCALPTLDAAVEHGSKLGWRRLTDAELEEWSAGFTNFIGETPAAAAWKRTEGQAPDSIAYWVATGPNAFRACAFSTNNKAGLREALKARFGVSADNESTEIGYWDLGKAQIAYSSVGAGAYVNFGFYERDPSP